MDCGKTHLDGAVYQTAISIFSAGYIAMQLPSAMLMTKLRPSRFLVSAHTLQSTLISEHRTDLLQPSCIIGWAIVSGLISTTNSPVSLLTVRFFLGMIEAPFFPGAIYLLSCWYTKRELGIRMALLICGILLSNSFAGLIGRHLVRHARCFAFRCVSRLLIPCGMCFDYYRFCEQLAMVVHSRRACHSCIGRNSSSNLATRTKPSD